jgi:hypothetical protein
MVDELGLGVTVVTEVDNTFLDEWQSFLCCFSVRRNMPDARFVVECKKRCDRQLFQWARRVPNVIFLHTYGTPQNRLEPMLRVPCSAALIRPLQPAMVDGFSGWASAVVRPARAEGWYYWVDTAECGLFTRADWIDRADCPLYAAARFATPNMTVSEDKVLRLWSQASSLFVAISRG